MKPGRAAKGKSCSGPSGESSTVFTPPKCFSSGLQSRFRNAFAGSGTPEQAAAFSEEVERRLAQLPDDLRRVALWKLEGYTNAEIARLPEMECSVRTVERKLQLIREAWGAVGA